MIWNIWFNIDYQCPIENILYDLSCFCFDHDCSFGAMVENWMNNVFQVTGSLNGLGGLYYDQQPDPNDHTAIFMFYDAIGVQVGKLFRYCLGFDPEYVDYDAGFHPVDWEERARLLSG